MSAEYLRETARMIRETARAATPGPWVQNGFEYDDEADVFTYDVSAAADPITSLFYADGKGNAEHASKWHPAVALAVADLMDAAAGAIDMGEDDNWPPQLRALAVARAWRGDA